MAWIVKSEGYLTEVEALKNAQLILKYYLSKGWKKESISAMTGNMWVESTVNPDLHEIGYGMSPDRGYGLVQWTPKTKFTSWATEKGLDPKKPESQLARIDYEIDNNVQWISTAKYPDSFKDFRANTKKRTLSELTEMFMMNYERPGSYSSLSERTAFAKKVMELDGKGVEYTDGTQLALLPIDVINITQGELGPYSHFMGSKNEYGIDFTVPGQERYPLYAPCDSEVISVMLEYAQVCWKASRPVMCADGQIREIWYRIVHDWNADKWKVGDTIKKGELIGHTGSAGMSNGDHLHLDVFKYKKGVLWSSQLGDFDEMLHNYDVFAINNVKKIIEDKGYNWRKSDYVDTVGGSTAGTDTDKKDNTIELLLCNALNGWYTY